MDFANYEASCRGDNVWRISREMKEPQDERFETKNLDVCVVGNATGFWNDTSNRQELREDFFMAVTVNSSLRNLNISDQAMHCVGTTTWGCFELPNYMNNNTAGPLLSTFSSESSFPYDPPFKHVCIGPVSNKGPLKTRRDLPLPSNSSQTNDLSGYQPPLLTAAIVHFSDFSDNMNLTDSIGIPYRYITPYYGSGPPTGSDSEVGDDYEFYRSTDVRYLENNLRITMFLANRELVMGKPNKLYTISALDTKRFFCEANKVITIHLLLGFHLGVLLLLAFGSAVIALRNFRLKRR